jgi:hypothetical protein
MLRLRGSVLSQPPTFGLRHRFAGQRVLTCQPRRFQPSFDDRKRSDRRRFGFALSDFAG